MAHPATALRATAVAPPGRSPAPPPRLPDRCGWYADPEGRATSRFFDGEAWTEHTRGPAPVSALTEAARCRAQGPVETRAFGRFDNRPAALSLVAGAISIVLNPLLVPSVLAVVLGVRGLRRARLSPVHRGRERSLAGIALGAVGVATATVGVVAVLALLSPGFVRAQHEAESRAVHAAVQQHLLDSGNALARLDCPPSPAAPPRGMRCSATTLGHRVVPLQVVVPADGSAPSVTDVSPSPVPAGHRHRP